jgi:Predicted transcriptional regulators
MDQLGHRVKELRKKKGLTQEELGKLSGIHYTNIGRIENKNIIPQADILYSIAKNLDTSVEWLLTGKTANSKNDRGSVELMKLIQLLTQNETLELLNYTKYILYQRTIGLSNTPSSKDK